MKKFVLILFIAFLPFSCLSQQNTPKKDKEQNEMKPSKNEDGEWDLTVIDTEFDYFLNAIAKPISQYSESF
jgi:PBP1b-binding outer membrane lipoprotein LpoB